MQNSPNSFKEIIYIMGMGRSGTTILDIVISNSPNFLSCGEITHIFRDGFIRKSECACGENVHNCMLWKPVSFEFSKDDLNTIQANFDAIESHKSFFSSVFNLHSAKNKSLYKSINTRIFNNLMSKIETGIIVDSSKYAGRAIALSKTFPEKVKVILLTRSPAGLYNSFKKDNRVEQTPKSTIQILLYYFYTLSCFKLTELKLDDKILKLQYDNFIKHPIDNLKRIEEWANVDLSESKKKLSSNEEFIIGHIVTGNRLRKKGKIRLQQNVSSIHSNDIIFKISVSLMNLYKKLLGY